ncbi:MAG TPA: hypothetical protein VJX91_07185 [Candidatus Eisenbacteria bacterium]|nr:hypothetical protein [Candidatus Eisenbacteria bacterium]
MRHAFRSALVPGPLSQAAGLLTAVAILFASSALADSVGSANLPAGTPEITSPTRPLRASNLASHQKVSATLPLTVHTTDGHSYGAKTIRLGWNDFLQIAAPSGHVTHVAANKVAKIEDAEGNDLTQVVLNGHEVIGTESGTADSLKVLPISDIAADQGVTPRRRPFSHFLMQGAWMVRIGESKNFTNGGYGPDYLNPRVFQAELGGMGRLGENYGVGLSVFLGGNDGQTIAGFKARARLLLGSSTYLDIAPGYISTVPTIGDQPESKGFVGEVTIMTDGWIGATSQFQTVKVLDANGHTATETWWYFGLKIGGVPGIFAALVSVLAVAVSQSVD